jgi:hypothetical protein
MAPWLCPPRRREKGEDRKLRQVVAAELHLTVEIWTKFHERERVPHPARKGATASPLL